MDNRWKRAAALAIIQVLAAISLSSIPAGPAAASPPGTPVNMRTLPEASLIAGASAGYLQTYWSRGPRGPMLSTQLIYIPTGQPPEQGWPIVASAHGTIGMADHCSLSELLLAKPVSASFTALLRNGYAVAATDYVGLGTPGTHPYLDGTAQAHSVIDGVRAARQRVPALSTRWAVVGQSQGGQTALVTTNIAPADAPELDFRGGASSGAPSNLELVSLIAGPHIPRLPTARTTSYLAMLLAGLRATQPELDVNSYLTPLGREAVQIAETLCILDADKALARYSIGQLLSRSLNDSAMAAALSRQLAIPVRGYTRPILLAYGLADLDVPLPLTVKLIADLRLNGTDLTVRRYPGDHLATHRDSWPAIMEFFQRVLPPR